MSLPPPGCRPPRHDDDKAVRVVAGNDVEVRLRCAPDGVVTGRGDDHARVGGVVDDHTVMGISQVLGTGDIRADEVTRDQIVAAAQDLDSIHRVTGDEIAADRGLGRAASEPLRADQNAIAAVSQQLSASGISADEVPLNKVADRSRACNRDALSNIMEAHDRARNDITRLRRQSPDGIVWRIPDVDPVGGVAQIQEPGCIRADEVPFDDVSPWWVRGHAPMPIVKRLITSPRTVLLPA